MNDSPQVDPMLEARQRVLAARNNVDAVLKLAWPVGMTQEQVLRGTVTLLEQAAVWLDGNAE